MKNNKQLRELTEVVRHVLVRRERLNMPELISELESSYGTVWQSFMVRVKRLPLETYLQRYLLDRFVKAGWLRMEVDAEAKPEWVTDLTEDRCCHCLQADADDDFMHRVDQFGQVFCTDRCYRAYMALAEATDEYEDDEYHPYYYDYTGIRSSYANFRTRSWLWQQMNKPEQWLAAIEQGEELAEDILQVYENYYGFVADEGGDGPLAAEIYRYACGLRQMLLDTLRNRLDLIEHFWEANWERLLNERASGQGAYRKSTVLMDQLTKMFSFYRTELPEEVEQALEQRFQPIFEKMLDWRPHRSGGLYAFGLDMKMVCYYSDEKKQIFRNLLAAMQQEGGLRLKNNCDPGTNADEYIVALEDFFCPTEESDYSWGFKSEQTRDRIFTQLQSFFERPDLRQFLLLEDEETPSALVKFQAYPCECSDGCYHYSREIDEEWYQKYTNGWYVCYVSETEYLGKEVPEDEEPDSNWDGIQPCNVRRGYRRAGLRVPDWAYGYDKWWD